MFRRFSTKVGLSKDQSKDRNNGVNGETNGTTNGTVNGTTGEKPGLAKRASMFTAKAKTEKTEKVEVASYGTKREDVETSFKQFAQLVSTSHKPLPTQTGDGGTYEEHPEPHGMFSDLKALGFKDARTLMDVMKTKAAGGLVDDRTYLMEKVIQVRCLFMKIVLSSANHPLKSSRQGYHQSPKCAKI